MEIEFDPAKDAANIRRRGIPLAFGEIVLANLEGEIEDTRRDYGEVRVKAFGQVAGVWFECVYTMRGRVTHIISVQ